MNIGSCHHGTNITMHCHLCQKDSDRSAKHKNDELKHQIESLTGNLASNMTTRQAFAMAAMQGILTNPYWDDASLKSIKKTSYEMADLMTEDEL